MNEISAIGVMSGSSLDGLDICYCEYKYTESKWQFKNLKGEQGTFFIQDPSGNVLEFKSFKDDSMVFEK